MAAVVQLVEPRSIRANKDNPRLIFRESELDALEKSIQHQGILVPLTIYKDGRHFTLLDGERRWRCAIRLGLGNVPAIIQDKPDRITNIMMMFAIHNARNDWDPLPTALKLQELEKELTKATGRAPTEAELAAAASLSRGEVRRYRKILRLPDDFKAEILEELEKPRSDQRLTVDHVLETISGTTQLLNREVVDQPEFERIVRAVVQKFREGKIQNTTEPRKLARIARSVERGEIEKRAVRSKLKLLTSNPEYTIEQLFEDTVERLDYEHATEQLVDRVVARLEELLEDGNIQSKSLYESIGRLQSVLRQLLRRR